jgi:FkbM family methyltransferase
MDISQSSHRVRVLLGRVFGFRVTRLEGLKFSAARTDLPWNIRKALYNRTYEAAERSLLRAVLQPGDRVLDIGACAGVVSSVAASIVGERNVLSYEANPAMEPLIKRNFALNRLTPNLRMRAITIDGRDVVLRVTESKWGSTIVADVPGVSIAVPSDALASVLCDFRPTVLAVDVEGAEQELLGSSDLPGVRKVVVEMHPQIIGQQTVTALEKRMTEIRFGVYGRNSRVVAFVR